MLWDLCGEGEGDLVVSLVALGDLLLLSGQRFASTYFGVDGYVLGTWSGVLAIVLIPAIQCYVD